MVQADTNRALDALVECDASSKTTRIAGASRLKSQWLKLVGITNKHTARNIYLLVITLWITGTFNISPMELGICMCSLFWMFRIYITMT